MAESSVFRIDFTNVFFVEGHILVKTSIASVDKCLENLVLEEFIIKFDSAGILAHKVATI